jgi:membrane peptidoglycan carboxypeptidase
MITIFCLAMFAAGGYFLGQIFAYRYVSKWADKLIDLDNRGLLSNSFGAAWKDILTDDEMQKQVNKVAGANQNNSIKVEIINGIALENYPSLKIVEELNKIPAYSNKIEIRDRNGLEIAKILTDHSRVSFDSFPNNLITAVVAAEDKTFFTNNYGFDYSSFIRALLKAGVDFVKTRKFRPAGTSTITQQVAKMFVSQLDNGGQRFVSRSADRKLQEVRIAGALRKKYSPKEIMEVYFNHCITSSYGLVGIQDITTQLWGKSVNDLSDAEAVYISRMVKWGMNYPNKIINQCRIDMPRIKKAFGWDDEKAAQVLKEIDVLSFAKTKQIVSQNEHLIDLANIYWLKFLHQIGYSKDSLSHFDILNSNSLIRQKGNLTITMTIDLPLQRALDSLVSTRGFGKDTVNGVEKKQYYAYGIIDSKTGKLLAYSSHDEIGSRAVSLLSRPIPNGSSTAKPILNALMFDLDIFMPNEMFDDTKDVSDDVAWAREVKDNFAYFKNSAVKNVPYKIKNSGGKLAGENFVFDLLTSSNNVLALETLYRLNSREVFDKNGNVTENGFLLGQLFYRLGILDRMKTEFAGKTITGVRVYKEIAGVVGANTGNFSDLTYSVALGTLELTLLEQIHLYNIFQNNEIIQNPKEHPSLFIDEIIMYDEVLKLKNFDTVTKVRPFSDLSKITPSALGMHNRLCGLYDGLSDFDILETDETTFSNIAKSGTSDDILHPFDAGNDFEKTNYCLWNAILRIDLKKFGSSNGITDVTIACVGEGSKKYTGAADGKSMHKYITSGLLKKAGIAVKENGFYKNYENYITSDRFETRSLEDLFNEND